MCMCLRACACCHQMQAVSAPCRHLKRLDSQRPLASLGRLLQSLGPILQSLPAWRPPSYRSHPTIVAGMATPYFWVPSYNCCRHGDPPSMYCLRGVASSWASLRRRRWAMASTSLQQIKHASSYSSQPHATHCHDWKSVIYSLFIPGFLLLQCILVAGRRTTCSHRDKHAIDAASL